MHTHTLCHVDSFNHWWNTVCMYMLIHLTPSRQFMLTYFLTYVLDLTFSLPMPEFSRLAMQD